MHCLAQQAGVSACGYYLRFILWLCSWGAVGEVWPGDEHRGGFVQLGACGSAELARAHPADLCRCLIPISSSAMPHCMSIASWDLYIDTTPRAWAKHVPKAQVWQCQRQDNTFAQHERWYWWTCSNLASWVVL